MHRVNSFMEQFHLCTLFVLDDQQTNDTIQHTCNDVNTYFFNKVDKTKIRNTCSILTQVSRLFMYGTQMCIVVDSIVDSVSEPTPCIDKNVDHRLLQITLKSRVPHFAYFSIREIMNSRLPVGRPGLITVYATPKFNHTNLITD